MSRRGSRALLAAVALLALLPAPAAAAPLLEAADAAELAQLLAEAQEEQGVCYGWEVVGDVESVGSSTGGPGQFIQPDPAKCERGAVLLRATVTYECSSCDSGDQASVSIQSTLPRPPTPDELDDLGFSPGKLTGDDDDQALIDMVSALPLLVAEHGQAPYIQYEPAGAGDVPARDRPTNSPGSDKMRAMLAPGGLGLLLILCGLGWFAYKRAQLAARRPRPTPTPSPPPSPPSTPEPTES